MDKELDNRQVNSENVTQSPFVVNPSATPGLTLMMAPTEVVTPTDQISPSLPGARSIKNAATNDNDKPDLKPSSEQPKSIKEIMAARRKQEEE